MKKKNKIKDEEEKQNNNNDDDNNNQDNNNNNQDNDNEEDNNEDMENGAKKINQDNDNKEEEEKEDKNEKEKSNENEKKEKIDEPPLNYPRFSTNSSNNNINHEENNIQNNYPKFSISSEKTDEENPYKEKEEENAKFSLARKSEGKNDEENNNNSNKNRDSNLSAAKYPIYDKKIINKNSFNINHENKQEMNNQNQKTENNLQSPPPLQPPNAYQNSIEETNANIINTNTSFNSLNNSSNIYSSDEKEDDNMENYSRFVFLISLFRRKQIILLFVVLILTMGSMISNVNNIKYIVVSIDSSKEISSTSLDKYPLLYFAFNSLTRIGVGKISNELMGTDETFTILISITIMGLISQLFGFFMTKFFVYLSISFAGMTHGGIMTFVPLYCRYYFSL